MKKIDKNTNEFNKELFLIKFELSFLIGIKFKALQYMYFFSHPTI
ncbi:hypothetical protein SAMN05192574_106333 [Mucilaginibacter gossypiicola]|uniref:Uncharacterized protein n=1 Tax=Mucilaginibacter gossypiicola TaxID=551995 RepID=A0A1H8NAC3_9SPHI|nr:hypothetical protein SAMN05192574_106333 [Mucilaginibacter gossypiicola]